VPAANQMSSALCSKPKKTGAQ